jgi:glycogen operon protein
MMLMGDEVRRSQAGNNNVYCQDNALSWFDWGLNDRHADIRRFTKHLIALRQSRELPVERLGMSLNELLRDQPVAWHGVKLASPDLSHDSHVVAATVSGPGNRFRVHFIINAYWKELAFEVPPGGNVFEPWRRCIDTSLDPPDDINGWRESGEIGGETYLVGPRSVVMLFTQSRRTGTK